MGNPCCNHDAAGCCCAGDLDKRPGEVLLVSLDMADWVNGSGTILTGAGDFTVSVWDVTNDAAAPAAPAGVGMVADSVSTSRGSDGEASLLNFGIEGGTEGVAYRIDFTAKIRDCNGFVQTVQNCVMVRVLKC